MVTNGIHSTATKFCPLWKQLGTLFGEKFPLKSWKKSEGMRKKICMRRDRAAFTHCMLVFLLQLPCLKNYRSVLQWAHEFQRDHSWSKVLGQRAACNWKQEFRSYSTRLCQVCCIQAPSCFPTMGRTRKLTHSSAMWGHVCLFDCWEKKQKSKKKKKSFESFGKKKVLKAKLTADRSSHSSEGASPMPHTADSWKLMWAPVSHQLMQLSAWHTCTCVDY